MIKVENIIVPSSEQWESVVRGMRNPMNSWGLSDNEWIVDAWGNDMYELRGKDLGLMHKLYSAGDEHRKYLRQLPIIMDITAPLYWWKEFDTYKIGTTANSCSTMHKIHSKEFTLDDFSHEHLETWGKSVLVNIVDDLNKQRNEYLYSKDKKHWWFLIQLLPSSYNQKRTVSMNYEVAINMIRQRTGHKLDEWNDFIEELRKLPHIKNIMGE